jgi:hypothetical protein
MGERKEEFLSIEEIFIKNSFEKFAFCKGETLHFFLSQKEKSFKKEVGNPAG